MSSKIKRKWQLPLFIIYSFLFSTSLLCASCSEWDDHYEADKMLLDTQQANLWQNIERDGNLSQFASLLKKAGYDNILSASQTYTVWAPVNGSFDYDAVAALSTERLHREFIENHIARSNYVASGVMDKRISTLNEKVMHFEGSQGYSIAGVNVAQANVASGNGIIHTINGKIPFMQNIYESLNNYDYPIDSISNFIHSYDVSKLNEELSIQGSPVDGKITYLDSIIDKHNDLLLRYNAFINREDSNYSMIVPTNEAWNKARETVSQYYKYIPNFEFMENTSTGSEKKSVTINIKDVEYLKDSIVNMMLTNSLFFNNNIYDNTKLGAFDGKGTFRCDSLYGTGRLKLFTEDASRLMENTTRLEKSNGCVWLTDDSLRMRTWAVWNPEITLQAESRLLMASTVNVYNNEPDRIYVTSQNPEVTGRLSGHSYMEAQPVSSSTNPGVVFYLPDVRSTTYSIYMVMVPAIITNPNNPTKPNRFSVSMGYADEKGKNVDNDRSWAVTNNFINDSLQIDTVYLGDFTFPVAYYGTGNYYPYLRVNSAVTSRERANYDRTLRIDCLILRPKELDDYLKEHPDYKYDTGLY